MSDDNKDNKEFKDAPDMSGAWRVIGGTAAAFVTLMTMGAVMRKNHSRKTEAPKNDPKP